MPHDPKMPTETDKKPSLLRRLGCGCLTTSLTLLLALVAFEIYLRLSAESTKGPAAKKGFYSVEDGRTFWPTPGWRGKQTVDGRTTSIRINSTGLRGAAVPPRSERQLRVLFLGDSMVFGHGVADDETIPARLQHHLAATLDQPVVVGNAGVSGHGTRDQALMLDRHRSFAPDVVVAMTYLGNDFLEDCRRHTTVVRGFLLHGPVARHAHESLRLRLALEYRSLELIDRVVSKHVPSLAFDRAPLKATPEEVAIRRHFPRGKRQFAGFFYDRRADDELVSVVTQRCRENYGALLRGAQDTPVLLLVQPSFWHVNEERWTASLRHHDLDPAVHERGTAQRRLLAIGQELGVATRDLTPDFESWPNDELWLPKDRHLSSEGCDQVARWILSDVLELL